MNKILKTQNIHILYYFCMMWVSVLPFGRGGAWELPGNIPKATVIINRSKQLVSRQYGLLKTTKHLLWPYRLFFTLGKLNPVLIVSWLLQRSFGMSYLIFPNPGFIYCADHWRKWADKRIHSTKYLTLLDISRKLKEILKELKETQGNVLAHQWKMRQGR